MSRQARAVVLTVAAIFSTAVTTGATAAPAARVADSAPMTAPPTSSLVIVTPDDVTWSAGSPPAAVAVPPPERTADLLRARDVDTTSYENGELPAGVLCQVPFAPGHRLDCAAAGDLLDLNDAYQDALGVELAFTDSYRPLAAQQQCYDDPAKVSPEGVHLCAVPGTSNHGYGTAIDFAGGIEDPTSPHHAWMRTHAPAYGWHLPEWARQNGAKPEPWHWEHDRR